MKSVLLPLALCATLAGCAYPYPYAAYPAYATYPSYPATTYDATTGSYVLVDPYAYPYYAYPAYVDPYYAYPYWYGAPFFASATFFCCASGHHRFHHDGHRFGPNGGHMHGGHMMGRR
jgi:hypothetical protein